MTDALRAELSDTECDAIIDETLVGAGLSPALKPSIRMAFRLVARRAGAARVGIAREPVAWIGPHANAWDALNETRKAVAALIGADPEAWPDHGNAPLAIAAALAIAYAALPIAREPTEAMLDIGVKEYYSDPTPAKFADRVARTWRAMYDAASEQPPQHDKASTYTVGASTDGQADSERA